MSLEEEMCKLKHPVCNPWCYEKHKCYDREFCLLDIEQIKEVFYQHAREHNWCRYETSGMPHEGVSYPLTRKDFELEGK